MFRNRVEQDLSTQEHGVLHHTPSVIVTLTGIILMLVALTLTTGYVVQATAPRAHDPLWDNFYRTERVPGMDYRFSQPRAAVLIPDPPAVTVQVSFRVMSPEPLPPRMLTVRYDQVPLMTTLVDRTPRIYHTLLPVASAHYAGRVIGLDTEGAQSPEDPRLLGLLFDYLEVRPLRGTPFPWFAVAVVAVFASVGMLLATLRSGWLLAGLTLVAFSVLLVINQFLFCAAGIFAIVLIFIARSHLSAPISACVHYAQIRLVPIATSPAGCLLLVAGSIYALTMGFYAIVNHELFGTNTYDLGIYDQSLWLISHGVYPYNTGSGRHVLGTHAAALLYPLSSLYWLLSDVRFLLAFQAVITALGVIPFYLIAQAHRSAWAGVLIALVYLLHPATQNTVLFDFHPDSIAATALLFALWGIDRRRWLVVGMACLITLTAKEVFSVTIAFLGVWLLVHKEWRMGAFLLLLGVGWFFFATKLLVPSLTGQPENHFLVRFSRYGSDFWSIVWTLLIRPDLVLRDMFGVRNLHYLWSLVLPFLFLPLLSPRYLVLALPATAINLLSSFPAQQTLSFHYNALIVAMLAVAALHGLLWFSRHASSQRIALAACAILLAASAFYAQETTELRIREIHGEMMSPGRQVFYRRYVLSHIPPRVRVSAQTMLQPHLSQRPLAYLFPNPFLRVRFYGPFAPDPVEYVVYDTRFPDSAYLPASRTLQIFEALQERGLYRLVMNVGDVVLLQRTTSALPAECFHIQWRDSQCRIP